jgi:dual specificity tyrosine-phosphorylation-regulated kinase 2/3/4
LKIVHCDLKPENVLILPRDEAKVKLIDFGSSCIAGHLKYNYIQSRYYRAPEVMIGIPYGPPMDIWSATLVLVELMIGKPLFPGDDELEQLARLAEVIGSPPPELVRTGKRRRDFFDETYCLKSLRDKIRVPGNRPIEDILPIRDPHLIDFVKKCLTWDPSDRMTASECLEHPFMSAQEFELVSKDPMTSLPRIHA